MEIDSTNRAAGLGTDAPTQTDSDLDRDAFMRLLVTQIRNQDPLDPMDTRDMMTQLTELTSVEHLIGIQDGINSLQVASASIANAQVADFVGQTVTADAGTLRLSDIGSASGGYQLDGPAQEVTVTIRDAEGRVVRTMNAGAQLAGAHAVEFDGNDDNGSRLPPGAYTMQIEAAGPNGSRVNARTEVQGVVTGVAFDQGFPELVMRDGYRVRLGDVREVAGESYAPTSSPSESTLPSDATPPPDLSTPSLESAARTYAAQQTPELPAAIESAAGQIGE